MIIFISNQKGGVGKTTTALNLAYGLTLEKKKVLLIDYDINGTLTLMLRGSDYSFYDVLKGKKIADAIVTIDKNLDFIKTSVKLSEFSTSKNINLEEILSDVYYSYDYIILDGSPSFTNLTVEALSIADFALVPFNPEPMSDFSINKYLRKVELIKNKLNEDLKIGLLATRVDARRKYTKDYLDNLKETIEYKDVYIFKNYIRSSSSVANFAISKRPLLKSGKSNGKTDYINFVREFITVS